MKRPIPLSTATLLVPNLINHSRLRRGFPVVLFALGLALFALPQSAKAADGAVGDGTSTAEGTGALRSLSSGIYDTAMGFQALYSNTSGVYNTATGATALHDNSTGYENTATGTFALFNNTIGTDNTATGFEALVSNTDGGANTATGSQALLSNTTGYGNTADGNGALLSNTLGHDNTADGSAALVNNTTGSNNVALGAGAGRNLTGGSNNIDIGANVLGVAGESAKIRIGKQGTQNGSFIAGIFGVPVVGSTVVVNSTGKLGVATSSARFKEAIKPMDKASESILVLKPVTFRYKEDIDPNGIPQFGLVAEEVEKVNPDLVVRGEDGKVMTVRYEAVNAMLLNEFLKEHRKVEEQAGEIAQQQKQIEVLAAGLQKVTAAVELNKSAPTQVADTR